MTWLVDGMNVIGSRPTGWWRDRGGAMQALVTKLGVLVARGDEVTVVLEGLSCVEVPEGVHGGVQVRHAERRGPDAADDAIVALVAADADPASVRVVTADRALKRRVEALGAVTASPLGLLEVLDALAAAAPPLLAPGPTREPEHP